VSTGDPAGSALVTVPPASAAAAWASLADLPHLGLSTGACRVLHPVLAQARSCRTGQPRCAHDDMHPSLCGGCYELIGSPGQWC